MLIFLRLGEACRWRRALCQGRKASSSCRCLHGAAGLRITFPGHFRFLTWHLCEGDFYLHVLSLCALPLHVNRALAAGPGALSSPVPVTAGYSFFPFSCIILAGMWEYVSPSLLCLWTLLGGSHWRGSVTHCGRVILPQEGWQGVWTTGSLAAELRCAPVGASSQCPPLQLSFELLRTARGGWN